MSFSSTLTSLQLGWVTTTGRLLGPTTCLRCKDGGIPSSVLPKDATSKRASLFSTTTPFVVNAQQESCGYYFLSLLVRLDLVNEP